jgi:F-type H+-transporting ATPase subunit epsilon
MSQEVKFRLEIVTPDRHMVSEGVEEITAPGTEGEFGVLLGHTPYLTELGVGELMFRVNNENRYLAIRRGFAEVTGDKVTILAEEADFPAEIDVTQAQQMRDEAEQALTEFSNETAEYAEARAKLERALNRIAVAARHTG